MSKANQAFKNAEEAVSPVIGVILMVAITVVLAAVVFVLVSNIGGDSESTPSMSFQKSESANTLTVVSADTADWSDITGSGCTATVNTVSGTDGAFGAAAGAVTAGDVITLTVPTAGCTLTLTYTPSNSLLGSWDFA